MDLEKYLGKEYKFNGRGEEGYDCLGLVVDVLADNNINLPDNDGEILPPDWMKENPNRLPEGLSLYCDQINKKNKQPLDVVVFEVGGMPRHAGILIDNYRFIHIFDNSKARISKFSKWRKKLHSIWRVR
jgi:cell wall-associated NlpC family hydrolase